MSKWSYMPLPFPPISGNSFPQHPDTYAWHVARIVSSWNVGGRPGEVNP